MKSRNPFMVLVLSLVTFGIYFIYWIASTQNAIKKSTGMGFGGALTIFFSIITCGIYFLYYSYTLGKNLHALGAPDRSILYPILSLFALSVLVPALAQSDINHILASSKTAD